MTTRNLRPNRTDTTDDRTPYTVDTVDTDPSLPIDNRRRAPSCAAARLGLVSMFVALVVTSVLTVAAEAQLPSTTPGPDGSTSGTNSSSGAGVVMFAVVVTVIIGGAVVLYLRHRRRPT